MQNKNFDNFLFSLFLSHSHSHPHSYSFFLFLSISACLSVSLPLFLSISSISVCLSNSLSLYLSISHTRTHTQPHTRTHTQPHTTTHTHSRKAIAKRTLKKVFGFLLSKRHLGSCDTIVNPISVNFSFLTRDLRLGDKTLRRLRSLVEHNKVT